MAKKNKVSTSNQLEIQNAAKTLYANIRFMSPDKPLRSLVITSSIPNEGKSTVSLNLAQAIASSGKKVLIVEADMRRRSLANILQIHPPTGVYSVLTEQASLNDAIMATPINNLYFLDVEPNIPNPADILSSKRYKGLVTALEDSFDYVIYDTPPVGTFVDAAILSTLVDGTLLVVRPKFTKRKELQTAYEQLEKAGANIIGASANFCDSVGSEYYYAYYTADGKRAKDSSVGLSFDQSHSQTQLGTVAPLAPDPVSPRSSHASKPSPGKQQSNSSNLVAKQGSGLASSPGNKRTKQQVGVQNKAENSFVPAGPSGSSKGAKRNR